MIVSDSEFATGDYDSLSPTFDAAESSKTLTTESTETDSSDCKITLFAQTYLRGENVSSSSEISDLSEKSFDNKTTSVEVTGSCCWNLFSEKNFQGKKIELRAGQYKSAGDLGELFRYVSSIRRC